MAIPASKFVLFCNVVVKGLKIKKQLKSINTGAKAIKRVQNLDPVMMDAAMKELVAERIRLSRVSRDSAAIRKAKAIEMPKEFILEYEKSVRFAVEKHGADLKNKKVKAAYDTHRKYAVKVGLEYYNLSHMLKRHIAEQKKDIKVMKTLEKAWFDYAKAFLAAATGAGTIPGMSGLVPMFWGNMNECTAIGNLMRSINGDYAAGLKIAEKAKSDVDYTLDWINEHIRYIDQKNYLAQFA